MPLELYDLGSNHTLRFFSWTPERDLDSILDEITSASENVVVGGAIIEHPHQVTGIMHNTSINFDPMPQEHGRHSRARWTVESFDPLTIDKNIECECGDRGKVTDGLWVALGGNS